MSQEELNYILKMLDEGSFSKAAEKLYTSHPKVDVLIEEDTTDNLVSIIKSNK